MKMNRLHQKFRNMQQQMTMSQQLELSKFELSHKNYGTFFKKKNFSLNQLVPKPDPEERISMSPKSPKKRGGNTPVSPTNNSFFTTSRTVMNLEKNLGIDKAKTPLQKVLKSRSQNNLKKVVNPRPASGMRSSAGSGDKVSLLEEILGLMWDFIASSKE